MLTLIRTLAIVAMLAPMASASWAQMPSLLPGKSISPVPSAKDSTVVVDANKELADAQARLLDTQDAINKLQTKLNQLTLPEDARTDLLKQFNQRQTLADRYAQQIDYLKQLQVIDQKLAAAKQLRDTWTPPAGTPPWPIMEGDQVRSEMGLLELQIAQLKRELLGLNDHIATYGREKADAEIRLRQAQDAIDKDPVKQGDSGRKNLEVAKMALAYKSAILLRSDLEKRLKEKRLALLEIQLETATKTWNYFDGRFQLTPEVLASAKGDLQFLIDRDRKQELNALAKSEAALEHLHKAQAAYQAVSAKGASSTQLDLAKANLDIAQADESIARSEVSRLRQLIEIGGYAESVWDARAELYASPPPGAARIAEISESVKVGLLRIKQARENLAQTLTGKEQEAFDLREAILFAKTPIAQKVLKAKLQAANAESDSIRLIQSALDRFEQFLLLLKSELEAKSKDKTTKELVTGFGDKLAKSAQTLWQYELFTVDDLVFADGKEIKTTRSVTIGKSVGAIGLLLFGYMLISWLIRAFVGIAEQRMGLKTPTGTLIRRWLTVVATGTLIILSFNLVQIPLSVFAFLGGALAIGIGFGTQNLLKNLISGAMLLIERPIRIGDFVEIDGVRGRVTSIGIRFSTIHSSDGIDTLIPNSELVEKKLTNWTFSNPDVRREVQIPVAYDADPLKVEGILHAAAMTNPDVMQNPSPMVLLDNFGDSALLFILRYWIRVEAGTDGRKVDSDLRRTILEKLKSAEIEVPYQQRDIHLSAGEPIKISIQDSK